MPLHTSYRPKKLKRIVGNKDIKESLYGILKRKEIPPAFLFSGESGCGKTTFARALAYELKVHKSELIELNAADDRGINKIRELKEAIKYGPMVGKKKFILLDEGHRITPDAQEALLKMLEEPPPYIHFAICTTEPEKLKATFKRRCMHYNVTPLTSDEMFELLGRVLNKELGNGEEFPQSILDKIEELADGSAGQALKLLDQVIDMADENKAIKILQSAKTTALEVIDVCRILISDKGEKVKWAKIRPFLTGFDGNVDDARMHILGYLGKVLVDNPSPITARMMDWFTNPMTYAGKNGLRLALYYAIFGAE